MSDNQVPAEMPQEDVETKSKLDLILSKIAELWTNIQIKFTTLTNHINTKTTEINSNTNSRAGITRDEINAHTSIVRDEINVHTAVKMEELKSDIQAGTKLPSIYTYNYGTLYGPSEFIRINQPCEILSIYLHISSYNGGNNKSIKMTIDDEVYYMGKVGGVFRYYLSDKLEGVDGVPSLLVYGERGDFMQASIKGFSPLKIEKDVPKDVVNIYTLGTIKIKKNFILEFMDTTSYGNAPSHGFGFLAR